MKIPLWNVIFMVCFHQSERLMYQHLLRRGLWGLIMGDAEPFTSRSLVQRCPTSAATSSTCHLLRWAGPSSRPSWSQRAPRAASVGNGMDLLSPAPDVTAAPALGSDRAPPGNLTFCHACTTHEWRTCYPCPVQNNSFEEQDTAEHKSVCYKVGCGFPWLPPVPAEFH